MPDPANPNAIGRRDAIKAVAALAAAPLSAQISSRLAAVEVKRNQSFDVGWRFLRGDAPGAEVPSFDDTAWRLLDLPHDWSVEDLPPRPAAADGQGTVWGTGVLPTRIGPFDAELSQGGRDTGWFVGGIGWYRKRFSASAVPAQGQVEIVFDGVYMNCDVWLNGHLLGNHPYGYTSFAYDLTPHLKRDSENAIAVRVRNEGRNSRWYSGSGIYRHVWLNTTGPLRVPLWGVAISTPEVSPAGADVRVAVKLENRGNAAQDATVRIRLIGPDNAAAGTQESQESVPASGSTEVHQTIAVRNPKLWSASTPHLYRAEVEVLAGGRAVDRVFTPFGIRKVEVDAEHGLLINGEVVKLRGGCVHHDNGLLGASVIDRAEERRIELLKAAGFNAIRTSHNPPSPAFLDACDRLGMFVMDEAFDQWEKQKNPQDYHRFFADWWRSDIDSMALRDHNHPSVILWSIGNEIPERVEPRGVEISKSLVERIKSIDRTRPVTAAINGVRFTQSGEGLDPAFTHLDVASYNYLPAAYASDHTRHPERIIIGTESFPNAAFASWQPVEQNTYVIGDFVWTAMDHLGESAIGNAQLTTAGPGGPSASTGPNFGISRQPFPWFNCYCGDIDLIGQLKPQGYFRRVLWGQSKLEMAVQRPVPEGQTEIVSAWGWSDELRSWTWPGFEGKTLKVRVYSSGEQVRLLLNGKEVGTSAAKELKAEFEVPYAAGELRAIALSKGEPIAELAFKTAGKPAKLRLNPDRKTIRRDRNDLSYVTLEVLDAAGNLVPDAVVPVTFKVEGAGALAVSGSANPKDVFSFRRERPRTYHGQCLAIVRPKNVAGAIAVEATAPGLAPATAVVTVG